MSGKTAAELQMEFLKKLKEQQQSGKSAKAPIAAKPGAEEARPQIWSKQSLSPYQREPKKRPSKAGKKNKRSLAFQAKAWDRLVKALAAQGFKTSDKRVSAWAADLLASIPMAVEQVPEELKADFFASVMDWCQKHGLNSIVF
jgi:hypothetical protein